MLINSISDLRRAFRHGPYAWPGGYPTYFLCDDGEPLCNKCARDNRREVIEAVAHKDRSGWHLVALDVNYEDTMHCAHCGTQIESACGEFGGA